MSGEWISSGSPLDALVEQIEKTVKGRLSAGNVYFEFTDPYDFPLTPGTSSVTNATLAFDGFNKMTIGATNDSTVESFGYVIERSTSASGPWTVVESSVAKGASVDVTITAPGFYRTKVQGTAGGVHITKAIANEIVYTPKAFPSPRYVGIFADTGSGNGYLKQLRLTKSDGTELDISAFSSTIVAELDYPTSSTWNTLNNINNDNTGNGIVFKGGLTNALLFYMDVGEVDIVSGIYEAYNTNSSSSDHGASDITKVNVYVSSEDPSGFTGAESAPWQRIISLTSKHQGTYDSAGSTLPAPTPVASAPSQSTVTDGTIAFDGFNKMTIGATNGFTAVESFGYVLERSTSASGPWTVVESSVAEGASVDVTVTDPGFYRAKVQGTAGGAAITKAIANEIVYTPIVQSNAGPDYPEGYDAYVNFAGTEVDSYQSNGTTLDVPDVNIVDFAGDFTDTNDATRPALNIITTSSDYSLSFWFNPTDFPESVWNQIAGPDAYPYDGWRLYVRKDENKLSIFPGDGATERTNYGITLSDWTNNWTHLVVTKSGVWVNGVKRMSPSVTLRMKSGGDTIRFLGSLYSDGWYYKIPAYLSDVVFYPGELTQEQIDTLSSSRTDTAPFNPVPSVVTGATVLYDGATTLTVDALGKDIDGGFGYAFQRATSASGPWTTFADGISTGPTATTEITQPGFYRAKAQGTAGGAAVVDALPMEIKYTPKESLTKYQYVGFAGVADSDKVSFNKKLHSLICLSLQKVMVQH